MSIKIRKRTDKKKKIRHKHKTRIRRNMEGTAERPRFAVFRSNRYLHAQIIDDVKGVTLVSGSTLEAELKKQGLGKNIESAKHLGSLIAKKALAKSISKVVFDRSGYLYHGKIKAMADSAREAGLKF